MFRAISSSSVLIFSLVFPFNGFACDDKSCEVAYLAETKQHISNHVRRAETERVERHAHSKNRERRAYALYQHFHMMIFGEPGNINF